MWYLFCKRKKNWNCILIFCYYLYGFYFVNNVNIYYIFYGCFGVLGFFLKWGGGGGVVWVDEILCIFRMMEFYFVILVVFCNFCWFCF